ncbi:MAG: alpha/beta hydrolase [Mycobacteriaceae bacterium]|nr:alpha/beta hydrolase [Mycobacteriaceae bacterium]
MSVTSAYRTGVRVLRGSPMLAAMGAGWLASEFPPKVVTARALAAVGGDRVDHLARLLAAQGADTAVDIALRRTFGASYADDVCHPVQHVATPSRPVPRRRRHAAFISDIPYGPGGRAHLLDIWRRADQQPDHHAPVLLQIPGGAWTMNDKRGQAYAQMARMVELGWICVAINYRRSPSHSWPAHIVDVKRALAWVRRHIADFGGDPDFIALTGGSAGGHLCALAALTANEHRWQPGFESADTTVQAAVPYYGVYDLTNVDSMHPMMLPFLERVVFKSRFAEDSGTFRRASPIFHVKSSAPPFFVLHGDRDPIVPSSQARLFCTALGRAGAQTIAHAELPNAAHAFDTATSLRSHVVADAVAAFLGAVYGRHLRRSVSFSAAAARSVHA